MRHFRHSRPGTALRVTGLALAVLVAGTGTGNAPASAGVSATTSVAGAPTHSTTAAQRELRRLEAGYQGRVGVYAYDTGTGRTFTYRSDERFPLLSTFKALAASAVLRKARQSDPKLLNRVIHWKASEVVDGSPITGKHLKDGMTVAELCDAALRYSDNTAGNMLLKQIGGPAGVTRFARSLGDRVTHLDRTETDLNYWDPNERRDTTTPADMGRDLTQLAVGTALHTKDRARLNDWLRRNTTGDDRVRAGLPKTWTVGDRTGSGFNYGTADDIAVAWPTPHTKPLVIAIYTNRKAADATYDNKVIADAATIAAKGLGKLP
ncbi:class A beta-lactamase [Nonomuraea fuscirosea]|uniref:class A beta-lactamase n=1 Tax=Nonomuraea fuscirosea TaxID=1291556 RepID=UPI0034344B10